MVKKYKTIYNKRGINGYRGNIEMNIITCAVYIVILLSLYYFVFWEAINDTGTRLHPATIAISKQLMPIYDKPMIYYPLSVLLLAGIKDILIITTPHEQKMFKKLLKNGKQWGVKFSYAIQPKPEGIAQALIIGEQFINCEPVTLILGDNIFCGHGFVRALRHAAFNKQGATVFGYWVANPERYGVVSFNKKGIATKIDEKPKKPKSNYAVTGLYCYDSYAAEYANQVEPSPRGELEITDLNNIYLKKKKLRVELLDRGVAWLDTGTHQSMLQANLYVEAIQSRQGLMISSPDEIAYRMEFINKKQLIKLAEPMKSNGYGQYLLRIAKEK